MGWLSKLFSRPEHRPVWEADVSAVDHIVAVDGGGTRRYPREKVTGALFSRLLEDTLAGRCTRLEVGYLFQGGGVYVKRLEKRVYRPFHSTLVLHHAGGKLALLFFAGDSLNCHMLISDQYIYCEVDCKAIRDVDVGGALLPEYAVHGDRAALDAALPALLGNVEGADLYLDESRDWATDRCYFGGKPRYEALRKKWGLLEE